MPGSRTMVSPLDGKRWYYANQPCASVPEGLGDEEAIRVIWAANESSAAAEPGRPSRTSAPDFGPNVLIFEPSMTNIQGRIDVIFSQQERSQFGSNRYAYLFKPGKYDLDVQVGFYMQVLGLGRSPDEVAITGAVRSKARWLGNSNATCNFWRSVENLSVTRHESLGRRLVQRRLYRRLEDRRPSQFRFAATMVLPKRRVG
jgi:hypothetical protein